MIANEQAIIPVSQFPVLATAPDRRPAFVYLARLAPRSRRTMLGALNTLARILFEDEEATAGMIPWDRVEYFHAQGLRTELKGRYAPATANTMLCALRGVMRECWRLGLIDAEHYQRVADVEGVRGSRLPRGRSLSAGEMTALFRACAQTPAPAGVRDAALLATLYAGGLRRSEAVALNLEDFEPETGALTVRHGKGDRERQVYLQNGAQRAMIDWLELRGSAPGAVFYRIRSGGRIVPGRLTDQAVLDILRRRCIGAGVNQASPHDCRRTMISDLLDAGADISTISKLAGHASVNTTQVYDRRGEAVKRKAAALIHVPYFGKKAS